ncbi:amino acid aminotransferase [Aurantivibrio plasticivorans]
MFENVSPMAPDPLLGISIAYAADENPNKVDLGVGVYKDDEGNTPIFSAVKLAEQRLITTQETKAYIGSAGSSEYNRLMSELMFGPSHIALTEKRLATVQTTGGCAALRVAAEFIKRTSEAVVWVSDPTWANHQPLLGDAGLTLKTYPYYDQKNNSILFEDMVAALEKVPAGDVVLLHGCCHNPSGADLTDEQWVVVADIAVRRGFLVFIDLAYQGFGRGLNEDAFGVRLMADRLPELVVASSCSKNFSIYRERAGTLCIVTKTESQADAVQTHLNKIVRGIYSMPPAHGASIVETLLSDQQLTANWQSELAGVRQRVKQLRNGLSDALEESVQHDRFDFIRHQSGMFSFLGITPDQVERLKDQYSIYIAGSSRINLAGLNKTVIPYVAGAIADVIR